MTLDVKIVDVEAKPALVMDIRCTQAQMGEVMGQAYDRLAQVAQEAGITFTGPPFAAYHDMSGPEWQGTVGFPVAGPVEGQGEVKAGHTPGGKAAMVMHVGAYEQLAEQWTAFSEWRGANGYPMERLAWEVYLVGPESGPDAAQWQTALYWAI